MLVQQPAIQSARPASSHIPVLLRISQPAAAAALARFVEHILDVRENTG